MSATEFLIGSLVWFAWIGVGLVLEGRGLLKDNDRRPPLTQVIVRYVPWYLALPFFVWLLWHFTLSYRDALLR